MFVTRAALAAVASSTLLACAPVAAEDYEGDEAGECLDGADNDRDGMFDCDDDGCAGSVDCIDDGGTDGGGDTEDGTGGDGGGDDTDEPPKGVEGDFVPYAYGVGGAFGYNNATGSLVDATIEGAGTTAPTIVITVVEEAYFTTSGPKHACTVTFTGTTDHPRASWAVGATWYGWSLPGSSTVTTDCAVDPVLYSPSDFLALFTARAWGLGIGTMAPDVTDLLQASIPVAELVYYTGGGSWADHFWNFPEVTGTPSGYWASGYARAWQMDASGDVTTDAFGYLIPIEASLIDQAGPDVTTAYYDVVPLNFVMMDTLAAKHQSQ